MNPRSTGTHTAGEEVGTITPDTLPGMKQGMHGPLISPYCWESFDYGDILHVAADSRLTGDPILGENERLRFHATRFDDQGCVLDAYDRICSEIADPYVHFRLPQGFLELPQFILSIVGAPGSGKSNYLSALINSLQHSLFQNYGMVLKDADPAGNAPLNDMKNCLFGGGSIEQAALLKTQLDGRMYLRIRRNGRVVSYPRPFVYSLVRTKTHQGMCNLIFYDNAGEHFEPGIDISTSPGSLHTAAAAALFFLVDPTTLPAFRQRLQFHPDPQLKHPGRIDQQDVLLAEMEIRIRKTLRLSVNDEIRKPLAIILGKSDIWMTLVDKSRFKNPIRDGIFDRDAVMNNSNLVRELLLSVAPTIVANAESLSKQVMYFPASAFGHSPTRLPSGSLAPNPLRIRPHLVEIPVIWTLSQQIQGAFVEKTADKPVTILPPAAPIRRSVVPLPEGEFRRAPEGTYPMPPLPPFQQQETSSILPGSTG